MKCDAQVVRINYDQGGIHRFIKGKLIEENEEFIRIELNNYLTTIYKKHIVKIEIEKPRGEGCY